MKTIVTAGIVLAVLVGVWMFVGGFAGWYRDPGLAWTFTAGAILVQIGVLVWGLMKTARAGRRYLGQVGSGLLISIIGGVLLIFVSLLFTTVAFPDYFDQVAEMSAEAWEGAGMTDEQIDAMLEKTAMMRTPWFGAISGLIGTMVTGLIISLITAAFVRAKA